MGRILAYLRGRAEQLFNPPTPLFLPLSASPTDGKIFTLDEATAFINSAVMVAVKTAIEQMQLGSVEDRPLKVVSEAELESWRREQERKANEYQEAVQELGYRRKAG